MSEPQRWTGRYVGRSSARLDGASKANGDFEYGVDVTLPGMLSAKVRRSDRAHAIIRLIDTSAAEELPGVRAVIVGRDAEGLRASRYVRDEPILAADRVRYMGEPVAAVAADSQEIAEEAVRRIRVEYDPLPVVTDPEAALESTAPLLHPEWETYWAAPGLRRGGNVLNHATVERGDLAAVFDRADHVFEDRFTTHMVHQASLEGRVAVADVAPDGTIHVISSHQFPFGLRKDLSDILGIPEELIRVTATGLGGGFGGKLYAGVEPICILLSQRTGRPVKLANTREEEFIATSPRMGSVVDLRTAVGKNGELLAREGRILYDAGAYSESSPIVVSVGLLTCPGPYKWQALKVDAYAVYTNKANCGSYRGPGAPQAVFAGETQLDRIADALGIDPLALRLMNAVEDGDLGPTGQRLRNVSLKECLTAAAERANWSQPRPPGRGRGIACCWWTVTGGASSAFIGLEADGSVVLTVGATEIGTAAVQSGLAQICAEELGVSLESVRIVSADTQSTPYDFGAQGSRTTFQNGHAIINAAADLKQQLRERASRTLDCSPELLEVCDNAVRMRSDPTRSLTFAELAHLAPSERLEGRGSFVAPAEEYEETSVQGALLGAMNSPSFSAHVAEVDVDRKTGELRLSRYIAAQDVGYAINPLYVEGQISGGATQGIGYGMQEELKYEQGRVLNPNFTDYKLPTTMDVPTIETIIVEQPSDLGPYGAKGVGEPSVIPPAAAISNALSDATGLWLTSLPLTAERIHFALEQELDQAERAASVGQTPRSS